MLPLTRPSMQFFALSLSLSFSLYLFLFSLLLLTSLLLLQLFVSVFLSSTFFYYLSSNSVYFSLFYIFVMCLFLLDLAAFNLIPASSVITSVLFAQSRLPRVSFPQCIFFQSLYLHTPLPHFSFSYLPPRFCFFLQFSHPFYLLQGIILLSNPWAWFAAGSHHRPYGPLCLSL